MPVAVLLAYLVPGAGHLCLGRIRRGLVILIVIAATFWAGMGIGGVTTVDSRYERWWFFAQMFTGVHGIVGWQRHESVHRRIRLELSEDRRYLAQRSRWPGNMPKAQLYALQRPYVDKLQAAEGIALVAPAETVARAYTGVSGMLNLLCIFDVLILSLMGIRGEQALGAGLPKAEGEPRP